MATEPDDTTRENNAATTWILVAIWLLGLILVRILRQDIPMTMLVIGTVFFIVLIPAMQEITRGLHRFFTDRFSGNAN